MTHHYTQIASISRAHGTKLGHVIVARALGLDVTRASIDEALAKRESSENSGGFTTIRGFASRKRWTSKSPC